MRNSYNQMNSSIREYLPELTKSVFDKKQKITQSFGDMLGSTISKVGQMKTNLLYTIKHGDISLIPLIHRKQIEIRNDNSLCQLLGKSYTYDDTYMFLYVFRNILWISYRKDIKQIQSDNGWGCMIRTVQMLFAEVLKRNLKLVNDNEKDKLDIIRYFSEQSQGIFSLSAICQEGNIDKRWTSSTQILGVFVNIIKNNPEYFNFEVQINPTGIVYDKIGSQLRQKYPVLINLSSRVSLTQIPPAYRAHYFSLMNHPTWVGTIGGIKGQALYIVGSYDDKVIFLDPHYVQSSQKQLDIETYFCQTPRGIQLGLLSPSIGFNYYIQDRKIHLEWLKWISNLSEAYYPNLIFQYISAQSKEKILERKNSEELQFELLE